MKQEVENMSIGKMLEIEMKNRKEEFERSFVFNLFQF